MPSYLWRFRIKLTSELSESSDFWRTMFRKFYKWHVFPDFLFCRFAARYWRIRLGGQDVNIDQFRPQWDIPVSKIVLHPKFGSPARYSNDMALLKLQRSIKRTDFAAPICLPEDLQETFDGVNATVVGWGRTNEDVEGFVKFINYFQFFFFLSEREKNFSCLANIWHYQITVGSKIIRALELIRVKKTHT